MSFNVKHGLIDEPTDLGLRLDAQVCVCVYNPVIQGRSFFGFVISFVHAGGWRDHVKLHPTKLFTCV